MTLGELFTGAWTWGQLIADVGPIIAVAVGAYSAGYERGRNARLSKLEAALQQPPATLHSTKDDNAKS